MKRTYIVVVCITVVASLWGYILVRKHVEANVAKEKCIFYLECIEGAKSMWASEYHHGSNETPKWDDLRPFLENVVWGITGASNGENLPKCPAGGTYTIGRVGDWAQCSIPGHALVCPDVAIVVEDVTSNKISNATVEIEDVNGNVIRATTDSLGVARFRKWPWGAVALHVLKDGYLVEVERLPHNMPPNGPLVLNVQSPTNHQ